MMTMKELFESAFQDKIDSVYEKKLKGMSKKPQDFDRDALELGVYAETRKTKNIAKALRRAMVNLESDPHYYDNFDDQTKPTAWRSATWTGGGQDYYKW